MKSYGQFCPVAKAAELFCERWTPLIIRELAWGSTRFSEIQRGVPLMSPTLLSRRLKQLESEGVIERRPLAKGRGWSYHLTEPGREFVPVIDALGIWGQRWSRRELADNEVSLTLLLWAIERNARADAFGKARAVVQVALSDQPPGRNMWWFVNQGRSCELCLHDPGFEVELYLGCTLRDLIYVVRGDLPLARAIQTDRLEVIGSAAARRRLAAWLNLGPLTRVGSQRRDADARRDPGGTRAREAASPS